MALKGAPEMALAMAWRIAHVVKTLVDRPMHVAIVKGLKRNLLLSAARRVASVGRLAYTAATMNPLHRFSRRGEVKSADEPASPESAILSSALALRRSTAM